jgi:carboxymethylenebutenolidase
VHVPRVLSAAALVLGITLAGFRAAPARPAAPGPRSAVPETSFVQIGSGEHIAGAYVAWPAGDRAAPAIIVVHEWWGLNGQIRDVARRLANQGYLVIVPDLYHGKVTSDPMKAHELMRGLEEKEALGTLEASAGWLRAQPRAVKSRVGVIGFCMGGGLAQGLALQDAGVAAVVMFYGGPETDPAKLANLKGALQAHFGEQDEGIPVKRVEEFRAALQKAGRGADIYVYPGAGHAFMHEGLPSYRPDAARQAWARTLAFFQKHLRS